MSDLSTAPRARLITAFGTVLYVDAGSGELRHGPVDTSPASALFVADESSSRPHRQGWLMHDSEAACELIVCVGERCHCISRSEGGKGSAAPTVFELVPLERGLIAFTANGLFLSAIPDGRISLKAPVCSTWELFLASENWCADAPATGNEQTGDVTGARFDKKRIESYIIHPLIRVKANTKPRARKLLIYGYTKWSHGRVYYDLCKHLHRQGYIVDILDWQTDHSSYIDEIIPFYDLFMTALDGVRTLVDVYHVPYERIIALSHHEFDMRMLIEQKGVEVFEKFGNYGVVSEFLYCASLMRNVTRVPMVASLGINYSEFHADIPERLATVGYAGSMSSRTYGIEWKRGELAEAAACEAGLTFKVAGSTGNQISFHDMPDFYRTVDAVLATSINEGAGLPVLEAGAAGRLVIGTPVGHFPLKAYQGGGIIAPIEAEKFKAFTAATLRYYKENPAAYVDKCRSIQEAARQFDWQHSIGEWVELIEATESKEYRTGKHTRKGIICDIEWLSSYLAKEHYYLVKLLQDQHGFDIINSKTADFNNIDIMRDLNTYDILLVAYQGRVTIPLHLISAYKIFKIDDLVSYNSEYDKLLDYLVKNSDMIISPYAYELHRYYQHDNVVWIPYSSAIEGCNEYHEIEFNNSPVNKVLLSGSVARDRPFREYVASLKNEFIDVLQHPGYHNRFDENSQEIVGTKYFRELNKYLCCFSDGHSYRYIHLKNFEIASVGSLLVTDKIIEAEMNELGFVDFQTCIFCDQQTFLEKLSWIFDPKNRAAVDKIRRAGMELVREKHLTKHRALQINTLVSRLRSMQPTAREPQPATQ
jgi:glycosyltransferase involved in cell wall biosynthesis